MCRWGCQTVSTTYMCKWCGTRYCKECMKGDFAGPMLDPLKCRVCNQVKFQGVRVECVTGHRKETEGMENGGKMGSKGRSGKPTKKGGTKKGGAKRKAGKKKKKK
ncbi:uncharacterized protein LOC141907483 [Tubulanus polymorphus]|uniref:uncharacterized protein LOC141907483 n=1 Tax=Tubulanus polymorphus TaxID=672921 RepID=UPI003DA468EB